jgi:integrase
MTVSVLPRCFPGKGRTMTLKRLTKTIVDDLEPRAAEYVEWCAKLKGFGCRVRPTGAKTFIAQYRIGGRNSPTRKVSIGQVGKLTVEEARDAAKAVLSKATLGQDVAAERARQRAEMSVSQLCDEYVSEGCGHKKASTIATDKGRIERHVKPLLGRKKIGEVTRGDVERFMRDVSKGKTAAQFKTAKGRVRVTGGEGTSRRTVRLLGGIFTYAVNRGYIAANPRRGVKVAADGKGERFLSPAELQRLGETLRIAEKDGLPWMLNEGVKTQYRPKDVENVREPVSPHAIAAVRLLLFTGCRLGEILTLKWEHVDFAHGMLHLPDSKTGAKKVLLGAPALQVLASLHQSRSKDYEYVIEGVAPDEPRHDIKRPWDRITFHAGLAGLRIHDLRHSFASVGAASGMGLPVVGKLLGHADPKTTARYSHLADDPLRRASDRIAATIAAAMEGQSGAVLPFERVAAE